MTDGWMLFNNTSAQFRPFNVLELTMIDKWSEWLSKWASEQVSSEWVIGQALITPQQ